MSRGFRPPVRGPSLSSFGGGGGFGLLPSIDRHLPGARVTVTPGVTRIDYLGGSESRTILPKKHVVPSPVPPPPPPGGRHWTEPWSPQPPGGRFGRAADLVAGRRAQEQARRQLEQARERERARQESERQRRESERARERDLAASRRREAESRERARREMEERSREWVHSRTALSRAQRRFLDLERQREQQQRAGSWLGTALAGLVPPGHRRWAMRRPLDDVMFGVQGADLIFKQADRTARQVELAMEDFSFWVNQAAQVIAGALGAAGEHILGVGLARAAQQVGRLVATSGSRLPRLVGEAASSASPPSIDRVLLGCRNEAVRITRKLVRQDVAAGVTTTPRRFGEIADAVLKSLVHHARRRGLLPQSIRTSPPPLPVSGSHLPRGGAIDVWDSATGVGWDLTTARIRSVADHERYLGRRMPDGTRIRDVRPLVYSRE